MNHLLKWLLRTMLVRAGLDPQEADYDLTYWEAKHELERKFPTIHLRLGREVKTR